MNASVNIFQEKAFFFFDLFIFGKDHIIISTIDHSFLPDDIIQISL